MGLLKLISKVVVAVINFFTARILTREANPVTWKMSSLTAGWVELDEMCWVNQQQLWISHLNLNSTLSSRWFAASLVIIRANSFTFEHYCKTLLNVKVKFKAAHTKIEQKKYTPQCFRWVLANTGGLLQSQSSLRNYETLAMPSSWVSKMFSCLVYFHFSTLVSLSQKH